jgi:predicted alpha/beta-hydrolase family hydrolase
MTISSEPEEVSVSVGELGTVTALLYAAPKKVRTGITIVLGHGAGGNQLSGFLVLFAKGLASRGLDTMTFNFLYSERGRGAPDHKTKLESCYNAVIEAARKHRKLKANRLAIGGKSMGGRIASQVAAAGAGELMGLVFLGYPLHPPGNPEKLRDAHLKDIRAPMLFVQGSRDPFGTPDELRKVTVGLDPLATFYEIPTGDHSFKVLKSAGVSQEQVYDGAMDEILSWLKAQAAIA